MRHAVEPLQRDNQGVLSPPATRHDEVEADDGGSERGAEGGEMKTRVLLDAKMSSDRADQLAIRAHCLDEAVELLLSARIWPSASATT